MIPTLTNPLGIDYRQPLTFTALTANSSVKLTATGSPTVSGLKYRTRSVSWTTYIIDTQISLNAGDYVQFWNTASQLSTNTSNYVKFVMAGSIAGSGNIQSLLNFSDFVPSIGFYRLFDGCAAMTSAPDLTARELHNNSYQQMFQNCTGLVSVKKFSATVLAPYCCYYMFASCGSLANVDDIRAETLYQSCFVSMFVNCSSLVHGPKIYATSTEAAGCLQNMFYNCRNLSSLEVRFTSWNNANTQNWLGLTAFNTTGTFICPSGLVIPSRDANGVPDNWTIVTQ